MPSNFDELKTCIMDKDCHIFDRYNQDGHGTTDYRAWLMADSTLTFSVADGQLIGDWARVKRHLKDAPQRVNALNAQGALCISQLSHLLGAIRSGADVDANGVVMDNEYFQRQAQNELNAVATWLAFVEDTQRLVAAGIELETDTRAQMDSLLQAKRSEWAQHIVAE